MVFGMMKSRSEKMPKERHPVKEMSGVINRCLPLSLTGASPKSSRAPAQPQLVVKAEALGEAGAGAPDLQDPKETSV